MQLGQNHRTPGGINSNIRNTRKLHGEKRRMERNPGSLNRMKTISLIPETRRAHSHHNGCRASLTHQEMNSRQLKVFEAEAVGVQSPGKHTMM
jgi:hypothetical protein